MNLQDRKWKAFSLISDNLFYIEELPTLKSTSFTSDYGIYDVVGATSKNNGNVGFLSGDYECLVNNGNCICLIKTGEGSVGEAVYKSNKFIASNNVSVIRCEKLNYYNGLFITNQINKQSNRYSYGYIRNNKRIKMEKIMLPINNDGNPDFEFMEYYMRKVEKKILNLQKKYIMEQLNILGKKKIIKNISECKWEQFTLSKLNFSIINSKAYHKENLINNGTLPYITRTHNCNGLTDLVVYENQVLNPQNTISFGAENADFFYQPYNYITGNKMYYIKCNLNRYQLFFLQRCLTKAMSEQFSFGYGMIPERIVNRGFMLPAKKDGAPDYEYMEQYIKNNMIDKYHKLLAFISG